MTLTTSVRNPARTGTRPGHGRFRCTDCAAEVSLENADDLPECPECGGSSFRRASIFESSPETHPDGTVEFSPPHRLEPHGDVEAPEWLDDLRNSLDDGRYLVMEDDGEVIALPLQRGWNRVGRSAVANVRLDDPSVSRRHALIVWENEKPLRVLDDRSLNGIFINGEPVEWGKLGDGDELAIGRYRLFGLIAG